MDFLNVQNKCLIQAAKAVEESAPKERKWRQIFHLCPKTGWMNDPNGLCRYQGEYHIFFQYSPFFPAPGLNYWGHYTTKDFVHYTYLPPALCCDQQFDCHGVYSGSALEADGKLFAYYTGNVKQIGEDYDYVHSGREHNTVLAVSEDGRVFSKKHLLLTNRDYPKDVTCHVRDPKVWKENGAFYMALGARRKDDVGEVLLYRSSNGLSWSLENILTTKEKLGYMWECPDVVSLSGKTFLLFSPQGVPAKGDRFLNVYQSGFCEIFGNIHGDCTLGEFNELDCGFDFYAPQTFEDHLGRRILIGWMGLPDIDAYYQNPTEAFGWKHCLTIPRQLRTEKGKLVQSPLEELKALRKSVLKGAERSGARVFEAEVLFDKCDVFHAEIRQDCMLDFEDGVFTLSFGKSGYGRGMRRAKIGALSQLQIFCDQSSVEIFINGGAFVFTSRFYPEENQTGIFLSCGEAKVWELDGFTIDEFCGGGTL